MVGGGGHFLDFAQPRYGGGDLAGVGVNIGSLRARFFSEAIHTALILSASFGLLRGESARNDGLVDNGLYRQRDRQCYFVTVY